MAERAASRASCWSSSAGGRPRACSRSRGPAGRDRSRRAGCLPSGPCRRESGSNRTGCTCARRSPRLASPRRDAPGRDATPTCPRRRRTARLARARCRASSRAHARRGWRRRPARDATREPPCRPRPPPARSVAALARPIRTRTQRRGRRRATGGEPGSEDPRRHRFCHQRPDRRGARAAPARGLRARRRHGRARAWTRSPCRTRRVRWAGPPPRPGVFEKRWGALIESVSGIGSLRLVQR